MDNTICCTRCETPVSFDDVCEGYFAVCPHHEEDLYEFETMLLSNLRR